VTLSQLHRQGEVSALMATAVRLAAVRDLDALRKRLRGARGAKGVSVSICAGTGCRAHGSLDLFEEFKQQLAARGLGDVAVRTTGCHGFCERGPLVVIYPKRIFYHGVKLQDVSAIIEQTIGRGEIVESLLYKDPVTGTKHLTEDEVPFYAKQERIVFRNNGKIDPTSIEDYIAADGYAALAKAVTGMKPEEVVAEVTLSGLRGRGGAGFPTGIKWQTCRSQPGDQKYIICNGDEGDPGAFMDRSIMEGDPHSVLEGMTIGAFGIGANKGYIYVRAEYPLAVSNLTVAVDQARTFGLLGENILGSGFGFDIEIIRGAGAFVCGEETALMSSIEGREGRPRPRPPFPAQKGLWDKPTNINNVETWANVSQIILRGGKWYASLGTEKSKGTKVFSLVGKVKNTGLIEVQMGTTLREIIYDIGGGVLKDKQLKAVQTGGPSGGCIPASLIDLPVDYEELARAGSIMGSGGLIVMDEETCMVDVAHYFVSFLEEESCGKCTPCREGIRRMREILGRIVKGDGKPGDIELLESLGKVIKESSLCGLGATSPNPVLTTLRYFRDEYEAHVYKKRCPAKVCKALIVYRVVADKCTGCQRCVRACPVHAISGPRSQPHNLDPTKCIKCGACYEVCRFDAIAGDAIYVE
jgi:NADH:ubiquinone oxidoreductase subunit F (NADH-binding)/(2Fe-2S) ferredoxin/NAD-dependent dihydropyrimidine dehydrogenase PreA subunit